MTFVNGAWIDEEENLIPKIREGDRSPEMEPQDTPSGSVDEAASPTTSDLSNQPDRKPFEETRNTDVLGPVLPEPERADVNLQQEVENIVGENDAMAESSPNGVAPPIGSDQPTEELPAYRPARPSSASSLRGADISATLSGVYNQQEAGVLTTGVTRRARFGANTISDIATLRRSASIASVEANRRGDDGKYVLSEAERSHINASAKRTREAADELLEKQGAAATERITEKMPEITAAIESGDISDMGSLYAAIGEEQAIGWGVGKSAAETLKFAIAKEARDLEQFSAAVQKNMPTPISDMLQRVEAASIESGRASRESDRKIEAVVKEELAKNGLEYDPSKKGSPEYMNWYALAQGNATSGGAYYPDPSERDTANDAPPLQPGGYRISSAVAASADRRFAEATTKEQVKQIADESYPVGSTQHREAYKAGVDALNDRKSERFTSEMRLGFVRVNNDAEKAAGVYGEDNLKKTILINLQDTNGDGQLDPTEVGTFDPNGITPAAYYAERLRVLGFDEQTIGQSVAMLSGTPQEEAMTNYLRPLKQEAVKAQIKSRSPAMMARILKNATEINLRDIKPQPTLSEEARYEKAQKEVARASRKTIANDGRGPVVLMQTAKSGRPVSPDDIKLVRDFIQYGSDNELLSRQLHAMGDGIWGATVSVGSQVSSSPITIRTLDTAEVAGTMKLSGIKRVLTKEQVGALPPFMQESAARISRPIFNAIKSPQDYMTRTFEEGEEVVRAVQEVAPEFVMARDDDDTRGTDTISKLIQKAFVGKGGPLNARGIGQEDMEKEINALLMSGGADVAAINKGLNSDNPEDVMRAMAGLLAMYKRTQERPIEGYTAATSGVLHQLFTAEKKSPLQIWQEDETGTELSDKITYEAEHYVRQRGDTEITLHTKNIEKIRSNIVDGYRSLLGSRNDADNYANYYIKTVDTALGKMLQAHETMKERGIKVSDEQNDAITALKFLRQDLTYNPALDLAKEARKEMRSIVRNREVNPEKVEAARNRLDAVSSKAKSLYGIDDILAPEVVYAGTGDLSMVGEVELDSGMQ